MRSRYGRLFIIVFVLLLGSEGIFASVPAGTQADRTQPHPKEEWTAWRGGELQGRTANQGPLRWSEGENTRWTISIPGRGTSSPVVTDDLVIVTTSYLAQKASHLQQAVSTMLLLLSGGVVYSGALVLFQNSMRCQRWYDCLGVGSFASTLFLLILLVIFGPSILDFDRCPIRSWLGSSVILTVALLLGLACCKIRSPTRPILGAAAIAFSIFVIAAMPSKAHAFRSGWLASSTWVVFAVSLFPFSTGIISLTRSWFDRHPNWNRRLKIYGGCLATVTMLLNVVLGARIVSAGADASHPVGSPDGILLLPTFAWALLTSVWTVHLISLCNGLRLCHTRKCGSIDRNWITEGTNVPGLREDASDPATHASGCENTLAAQRKALTPNSWRIQFAVTAAALIGTFAATGIGVYLLMVHGRYLPYHLAIRRFDPVLGWQAFLTLSACVSLGLIVATRLRSFREWPHARWLFQFGVLSLGMAAFSTESLLKKDQLLTRAIVAIDRNTGQFRWVCEALNKPEGPLHRYNSAASPTPVIKDNRVFAYFGSGGAMCSDMKGKLLWTNEDIIFHSAYGAGASPCVADGVLVIVNGMSRVGYVCGLDCSDGKTIWRKPMPGKAVSGNSRTPIARMLNGKMTALVWGFEGLTGFDVSTGDELFSYPIGNGGGDQVSSIVTDGPFLYCIGGATAISLHLDQLGKAPGPPIAWTRKTGAVNCASPVIASGMAFCVTDTGIASCLDLQTGATCWRQRLTGEFYASPIACGEHVYFTNLDGLTSVIEVDQKFKLVAENSLTGQFLASPAANNYEIYLRSSDRLYCIGGPYRHKSTNSIAEGKRHTDEQRRDGTLVGQNETETETR